MELELKKVNRQLMRINPDTFDFSQLNEIDYFQSEDWRNLWATHKPKNTMELLILMRVRSLGKAYFDLKDAKRSRNVLQR